MNEMPKPVFHVADEKACRSRRHPITETPNGLWWCRICHQRDDDAFAEWSRQELERAKARMLEQVQHAA